MISEDASVCKDGGREGKIVLERNAEEKVLSKVVIEEGAVLFKGKS